MARPEIMPGMCSAGFFRSACFFHNGARGVRRDRALLPTFLAIFRKFCTSKDSVICIIVYVFS
jgi:hypothetical protein